MKYPIMSMALLLAACGGGGGSSSGGSDVVMNLPLAPDAVTGGDWYQPAPGITWQWQLSGTVKTTYDVDLYDIDLFDTDESVISALQDDGIKVICYFSGGSWEDWRDDADEFVASDKGRTLDGWEDERWLDIRSENVQSIMQARLDLAVTKGCDGVEPDNMDGYSNNNGLGLSASDQLAYNRFIANEAHERGLAVALKNDLGQIEALVDYFDFAVNEQCAEYDECELLSPFIEAGKAVLQAEYNEDYVNDASSRAELCDAMALLQFSTLVLPLLLDDEFRYACN